VSALRRTDRLTPAQRAEITATVATWPPLTEAKREMVRALFDGHEFPPSTTALAESNCP
jgi:hypothetical protein